MKATPFWDWALAQYRSEATQHLLLRLQEESGLVILEALFVSWLASEGYQWRSGDTLQLRDATQNWIDEVVLPLRAVRERWKSDARTRRTKRRARKRLRRRRKPASSPTCPRWRIRSPDETPSSTRTSSQRAGRWRLSS